MTALSTIYDKTDKGREEIGSRRYGLAARLRPLLVMVDGRHAAGDLLGKVSGLGLGESSISELLDSGFIQVAARAGMTEAQSAAPACVDAVPEAADAGRSPNEIPENRFLAVYHFYNETIKSTIGLRGYGLQLKVEKAATLDDLRQLRVAYVEAVQKAKGNEVALSLSSRLDALLGD